MKKREITPDYFEAMTIRLAETGCQIWMGCITTGGYGALKLGPKKVTAHRVSWQVHRGQLGEGDCVLHRCDVRACVNPDHLFIGTISDNVRDMWAKGRGSFNGKIGVENYRAKLNPEKVTRIRALAETMRPSEIAKAFGVTPMCVDSVLTRRTWNHVL